MTLCVLIISYAAFISLIFLYTSYDLYFYNLWWYNSSGFPVINYKRMLQVHQVFKSKVHQITENIFINMVSFKDGAYNVITAQCKT